MRALRQPDYATALAEAGERRGAGLGARRRHQARNRRSHYNPNPLSLPAFNMTDDPTVNALRAALDTYVDPYLGESLGAAQAVQELAITAGGVAAVRIRLGFPVGGYRDELTSALKKHLTQAGIDISLTVELAADIRSHAVQRNLKPIEQIKNVVAVASGKG